jgi:nucleotide-binding universal stress UspA family protein
MRDAGPILVPLDGSPLAEGAIPYAVALASGLGERIELLTVWEGNERDLGDTFPAMATEIGEKADEYFSNYLEGIRARIGGGAQVATHVASGASAATILGRADEIGARVIVLATHGRSGVGRWMYGSTAGRLLHESHIPLVAVGPGALQRSTASVLLKHLMVPLDGSDRSEAALPIARSLASRLGARVSLVRVVHWAAQAYPYTLPESYLPQVDDELETGAKKYLQQQEEKLKPVPADAFIVRGAVAEGLMEFVDKQDVGLIVMTTHARSGIARAALGSTADRMLQAAAPVLLIPPDALERSN